MEDIDINYTKNAYISYYFIKLYGPYKILLIKEYHLNHIQTILIPTTAQQAIQKKLTSCKDESYLLWRRLELFRQCFFSSISCSKNKRGSFLLYIKKYNSANANTVVHLTHQCLNEFCLIIRNHHLKRFARKIASL